MYFSIAALYTQESGVEDVQSCYLFTTLFIGATEKEYNCKEFVEYDNRTLSPQLKLYDQFFKKNFPEIADCRYCAFFPQESLDVEDSAKALVNYLKKFRLDLNEKSIEPVIQCEVFGDRAANIFLTSILFSGDADIPQAINTVSFYNISDEIHAHTALTSSLIRRAYFFMQKGEKKNAPILGGAEKNTPRISVLYDPLPKELLYPFWVFSPVFLRHLWVVASSAAHLSVVPHEKSAVLTCGNTTIDVSNALFPILQSARINSHKKSAFANLIGLLKSLRI